MPDAAAIARSYAECRRIARDAASNFYFAFYLLPRPKRDALCALYAFMRRVDDVSDSPGDLVAKQQGLTVWRVALDDAATGRTQAHPILPALHDTLTRYSIPARYLHDLISGAEMDLTVASYPTYDRLLEYCYRVAGTVGITCTHVFGFRDPRPDLIGARALDLAEKLGIAFQLTNILRDLRRDSEMGRVYLPDEDLARFHVRREDLAGGDVTLPLVELLRFEAERAWELYSEGVELLPLIDPDGRGALWGLVRTYSSLLGRIEARGFDIFSSRIIVPAAEKAAILVRARLGWWNQQNVLEERARDRRGTRGSLLRRRAG